MFFKLKNYATILVGIIMVFPLLIYAQQSEKTLPLLDERYVEAKQLFTGLTIVGCQVHEGGAWTHARAANIWDPVNITDWAFLLSGEMKIATIDTPKNTFDMDMNHMANDPRTLSASGLYLDCADGTTYKTYTISKNGMDKWENLSSSYIDYIEGRLDESWCAAGFKDDVESSGSESRTWLGAEHLKVVQEIRMSSSGTLSQDERWGGTHTLTGDVYVPSGITLTIWKNATINMNGHKLLLTGGTLTKQSNVTFNPDIRLMDGSTLEGQYPNIQGAINDASYGQIVHVIEGVHVLTADVTVPPDITLEIHSGVTVNLNGYYLKSTGGTIIKEGSVTFNPDIRLMDGSTLVG